jgi:hypothetical protein
MVTRQWVEKKIQPTIRKANLVSRINTGLRAGIAAGVFGGIAAATYYSAKYGGPIAAAGTFLLTSIFGSAAGIAMLGDSDDLRELENLEREIRSSAEITRLHYEWHLRGQHYRRPYEGRARKTGEE